MTPLGRGLFISWDGDTSERVIGVVGDVQLASLDGDVRPTIYWPHSRVPYGFMTLVMRTATGADALAAATVAQVRSIDPNLPVSAVRAMTEVVSDSVARPRLTMTLLGVFAGLALLLAAVGLYGVVSYTVAQRTHEIGLRMALGASRAQVLSMVLKQGTTLIAGGVVIGITGALLVTRLMSSLLFGVTPTDPTTYVAIAIVMAAVAFAAIYVPARRATGIDPMEALRYE